MRRPRQIVFAVAAMLAACSSASAQQVGQYTGTAKDGSYVSFTVGTDPANGDFELTIISIDFTATCQKSQEQVGEGVGDDPPDGTDIINGKVKYTVIYQGIFVPVSLTFEGTQKLKGMTSAYVPEFNPVNVKKTPTDTQLCVSAKQPLTATFQGADAVRPIAPGTVTVQARGVVTTGHAPGQR
jgi:hypothetical protein